MSWDIASCNDAELITIADRLNKCKESKVMLDLELSNEEFNLKYIYKRKEMTAAKIKTRMNFIIPFTLVEIFCVILFGVAYRGLKMQGDLRIYATEMLIALLGFFFCGYICLKLWIPEIKMFGKFNPLKKKRDGNRNEITFEVEKQKAKERISMLKAQLETVNKEIAYLSEKRREREAIIRVENLSKKEMNYVDNSVEAGKGVSSEGAFKLRRDVLSNVQTEELLEHYTKELKSLEKEKASLEIKDKMLQDRIIDIDVQMSIAKNRIAVFVLVATALAIIAGLFPGNGQHVVGLMWLIVVIPYFLWLVNVCKEPVVMYLVEHEHKQIQDYAFTQSLTPLYKKRKELAQDITDCVRRINYYEEKKEELS